MLAPSGRRLREVLLPRSAAHTCSAVIPEGSQQMSVRLPAFDGDPGVRPSWRAHVESAAVWEPVPDDGLERYQGAKPR